MKLKFRLPCTAFLSKTVWSRLPRSCPTAQLAGSAILALPCCRECYYWPGCSMRRVTSDQSGSCAESRATTTSIR